MNKPFNFEYYLNFILNFNPTLILPYQIVGKFKGLNPNKMNLLTSNVNTLINKPSLKILTFQNVLSTLLDHPNITLH